MDAWGTCGYGTDALGHRMDALGYGAHMWGHRMDALGYVTDT